MSRIRIVVADQAEAIFYDAASLRARPIEVGRISDPVAHLYNRDMMSDRPGRSYESVGGQRHAIERENDPRRREALRFAKRISRRLDDARRQAFPARMCCAHHRAVFIAQQHRQAICRHHHTHRATLVGDAGICPLYTVRLIRIRHGRAMHLFQPHRFARHQWCK